MEIKLTSANYSETVSGNKPVLIDFWASWCGPCRMLAPTIEAVAKAKPDAAVCKLNVDEEPAIANKFGVQVIPTLVVLKNGREVARAEGLRSKSDIISMIDRAK